VIVCPPAKDGPSLAAFNKDTGDLLWSAGTDRASYSSPMLWLVDGSRQIVLHDCKGLSGYDDAGKPLWQFNWTNASQINAAQPIADAGGPGTILVSTGYSQGTALVRVKRDGPDRWSAEPIWRSKSLKTKFTSAVLHGGHLYGLDDGTLACVDIATGKLKWKDGRYGHGQTILAGDRLLVQAENGEIILIQPAPDGLRELSRITALEGKTWNMPSIAGGHLLIRNDHEAACYELPRR